MRHSDNTTHIKPQLNLVKKGLLLKRKLRIAGAIAICVNNEFRFRIFRMFKKIF
jgi:hypothetical protein